MVRLLAITTRFTKHRNLCQASIISLREGEQPHVVIGDHNVIRENVLIAGSNKSEDATRIGSHNHLMNKVHICHDVQIGDYCVLGISASVAGACQIGDYAILSSSTIVQRKVRVGKFALLQSGTRVQKDVMPYAIFGGNPPAYRGVNTKVIEYFPPTVSDLCCAILPTPSVWSLQATSPWKMQLSRFTNKSR